MIVFGNRSERPGRRLAELLKVANLSSVILDSGISWCIVQRPLDTFEDCPMSLLNLARKSLGPLIRLRYTKGIYADGTDS